MNMHYLQHVDFEGPAAILTWAQERDYAVSGSHVYRGDALPDVDAFDLLVVMGGPMSVNDEQEYPWLAAEKSLVHAAVRAGKAVLGVCLGAQMIAAALGARVYRAAEKEIGWFPVQRVTAAGAGAELPADFVPLHWHGETFDLPTGAVRLAATPAVPNQAFAVGLRVVGLQFHLEATAESVAALVKNCANEIKAGRYQQTPEEIAAGVKRHLENLPVLWTLLDHITG
jgi:GMP synthase-like glutamine amidotransferase